jgi:hypothetical protein
MIATKRVFTLASEIAGIRASKELIAWPPGVIQ